MILSRVSRLVVGLLLGPTLSIVEAGAETLVVTAGQRPASLVDFVEVLEDASAALSFQEVTTPPVAGRFQANEPGRRLDFGNTRSAYWFRFRLANSSAEAIELLLQVDYPALDRIDFYPAGVETRSRPEVITLGDSFPFDRRQFDVHEHLLPLTVPAASTAVYHLRVESVGSISVPLTISGPGPYLERSQRRQLVLGMFYGILLGAVLYNLFLFSTVRDPVYIYLVGHVVSLGMGFACIDGLAFRLWPSATGWQQWAIYVFINLFSVFTVLFVRQLLGTAESPQRLERMLSRILWLLPLSCAVVALGGVRAFFYATMLWLMAACLLLSLTVFRHLRRRRRGAQIYAIAWGVMLMTVVFLAGATLGLIPRFMDLLLAARIAIAAEVILAAMAVASSLDETRQALAVSIEQLEAKNAELESFCYTVSHDLKSPLVTINSFLGLLEEDAKAGDESRVRQDAERIRSAVSMMGRLLTDLLEISRVGRVVNPSEELDLGELAAEAVELLAAPIAARGVDVEISPDLPRVFGDRTRLLEVFQNLVENAVAFMGDQPTPRIEIGTRLVRGEPACTVRDNGIGIEPQYHDKVFELFERLDASVEGTGIGLALVKRIVEVHGGHIWIESAGKGQGTTFCFAIPQRPAAAVA